MTVDLGDGDIPRDIGQTACLIDDRAGHANRGGVDDKWTANVAREGVQDRREAVELLRQVRARDDRLRPPLAVLEKTEKRLGPSEIAGEDHSIGPYQLREL